MAPDAVEYQAANIKLTSAVGTGTVALTLILIVLISGIWFYGNRLGSHLTVRKAIMHKVIALVIAMLFCAFAGMSTAAAQSGVSASATINGHNVNGSNASDPVQLRPGKPADVAIELTNDGSTPVQVTEVELAGRVLGLSFFTYATTVDFAVQPGSRETLRYQLNLTGLRGQATGLMGGQLILRGAYGETVATMPVVTDVRGSLLSVYGVFGVALVVLPYLRSSTPQLALRGTAFRPTACGAGCGCSARASELVWCWCSPRRSRGCGFPTLRGGLSSQASRLPSSSRSDASHHYPVMTTRTSMSMCSNEVDMLTDVDEDIDVDLFTDDRTENLKENELAK